MIKGFALLRFWARAPGDLSAIEVIVFLLLLDTKKMPLGKLSKSQIAKGFEVLDEMESTMKKKKTTGLMELSSQFYTIIPHNFGRQRPPVISTLETVRQKLDMLQVCVIVLIISVWQAAIEVNCSVTIGCDRPLERPASGNRNVKF